MSLFWIIAFALLIGGLAKRYLVVKSAVKSASTSQVKPEPTTHKSFHTKVVGVTFPNEDGRNRQAIIKQHCKVDLPLELIPEPNNPKDPSAIGVWANDSQIGYIPGGRTADDLSCYLHQGKTLQASVSNLTGGTKTEPTLGVNVLIKVSS